MSSTSGSVNHKLKLFLKCPSTNKLEKIFKDFETKLREMSLALFQHSYYYKQALSKSNSFVRNGETNNFTDIDHSLSDYYFSFIVKSHICVFSGKQKKLHEVRNVGHFKNRRSLKMYPKSFAHSDFAFEDRFSQPSPLSAKRSHTAIKFQPYFTNFKSAKSITYTWT